MAASETSELSDAEVVSLVLAAVTGRPRLAGLKASASALAVELGTAQPGTAQPGTAEPDKAVPPGDIPDVDLPHVTRPRIDQPLGDPPGQSFPPSTFPPQVSELGGGVFDAEIVDDIPATGVVGDYTQAGVPTWDRVRDKVENRSGTAMGREELDHLSPAGKTLDDQWNERQDAAKKKLDAIRQSMKDS